MRSSVSNINFRYTKYACGHAGHEKNSYMYTECFLSQSALKTYTHLNLASIHHAITTGFTADAHTDAIVVSLTTQRFGCQDSLCSFSLLAKVFVRNEDGTNGSVCIMYGWRAFPVD